MVIVGDAGLAATADVVRTLRGRFRPRDVTLLRSPTDARTRDHGPARLLDGHFAGRPGTPGDVTLYACTGGVCRAPVTGAEAAAVASGSDTT
jgi:hypothetical protein